MTLKRYLLSVGFILVFPIQGAHANEPSPTKEDRQILKRLTIVKNRTNHYAISVLR